MASSTFIYLAIGVMLGVYLKEQLPLVKATSRLALQAGERWSTGDEQEACPRVGVDTRRGTGERGWLHAADRACRRVGPKGSKHPRSCPDGLTRCTCRGAAVEECVRQSASAGAGGCREGVSTGRGVAQSGVGGRCEGSERGAGAGVRALEMTLCACVQASAGAVCVLEVGTADGRGTTMALVTSLDTLCRGTGRKWRLFSYEGLVKEYGAAKRIWQRQEGVSVINELVMTEKNLETMVLPYIDAPPGKGFPGREFYEGVYRGTKGLMQSGKMGPFLGQVPQCARGVLDFVSIDTTRHTFAGILQSLVDKGAVDEKTVYVMENDFWTKGNGARDTAAMMISRFFDVRDLVQHASGHDFPWVSFRLGAASPAANASTPAPGRAAVPASPDLPARFDSVMLGTFTSVSPSLAGSLGLVLDAACHAARVM